MSWSITIIGHPANVATALTAQSEKLDGQSKVEFDSALPHMVALVNENFNSEGLQQPVIKLAASGHGYAANGEQKQRSFTATIEPFYATLV
jgi:hypothetical protein